MLDIEMNGHILSIFCCRSPRRGAWIEMTLIAYSSLGEIVAPRVGERGLKSIILIDSRFVIHVAPRVGERGLKSLLFVRDSRIIPVAPRVGERGLKSASARPSGTARSRSPRRGAWIEILIGSSLDRGT